VAPPIGRALDSLEIFTPEAVGLSGTRACLPVPSQPACPARRLPPGDCRTCPSHSALHTVLHSHRRSSHPLSRCAVSLPCARLRRGFPTHLDSAPRCLCCVFLPTLAAAPDWASATTLSCEGGTTSSRAPSASLFLDTSSDTKQLLPVGFYHVPLLRPLHCIRSA
jgi:hypothetical protein